MTHNPKKDTTATTWRFNEPPTLRILDRVSVSDSQTHWLLVLVIAAVVGIGLLAMSQMKRLNDYDRWYACMMEKWDEARCNVKIYGQNGE